MHPTVRDQAAASLFSVMALALAGLAVVAANPLPLVLAIAAGAAALVAELRGYPLDRDW